MRRGAHRAVLFDLFDTLCWIDEGTYLAGKREAAVVLDLPFEPFLEAWVACGDRAQIGALPDIEARVRRAAADAGGRPDDARVSRAVSIETATMLRATSLYADAIPALAALRRRPGLRLGLVSNASSTAALLFEHLGLRGFFDEAVFSFRVGTVKPEPAIYLAACAALRVAPADCLFVGDGNARELDGASRLGMETVRIERPLPLGRYRKGESTVFDWSVGTLTHLPPLVRDENGVPPDPLP